MQSEMIATAAGTGIATFFAALAAMIKGVVFELLGVPLPVVLAAATAAFFAGSFRPSTTYRKALTQGCAWTLIGVFLSSLVLAVVAKYFDTEMPAAALAGTALILAGAGQLLCPLLWPVIQERLPLALRRRIDQLGGTSGADANGS